MTPNPSPRRRALAIAALVLVALIAALSWGPGRRALRRASTGAVPEPAAPAPLAETDEKPGQLAPPPAACAGREPVLLEGRYVLSYRSKTELAAGGSKAAEPIDATFEGTLDAQPAPGRAGERREVALQLKLRVADLSSMAAKLGVHDGRSLRESLSEPWSMRVAADGRLEDARFPGSVPPSVQVMLHQLAEAAQVQWPAGCETKSAWEGQEKQANGPVRVSYAQLGDALKKKLADEQGKGAYVMDGTATLTLEEGRLDTLTHESRTIVKLQAAGQAVTADSTVSVRLRRDAPEAAVALAPEAVRDLRPLDMKRISASAQRVADKSSVRGRSVEDELVDALEKGGEKGLDERGLARGDLQAALRLTPGIAPQVKEQLLNAVRGSTLERSLIEALVGANVAEANDQVLSIIGDKKQPKQLRQLTLIASTFTAEPSEQLTEALTLVAQSDPELALNAVVAEGGVIGTIGKTDPEKGAVYAARFVARAEAALPASDIGPDTGTPRNMNASLAWLKALGGVRSPLVMPLLERALQDEEPWVRAAAVYSMRYHPTDRVKDHVSRLLLQDGAPGVREMAVLACLNLGRALTLDLVEKALVSDEVAWVRLAAADVIGAWALYRPGLRRVLEDALPNEKDETVQDAMRKYITPGTGLENAERIESLVAFVGRCAVSRLACVAAALALLAACGGGDKECGPDTTLKDGACVAAKVTCGTGLVAVDGRCVPADAPDGGSAPDAGQEPDGGADCTVNCEGRVCGDDGCGGSCGACDEGRHCSLYGTCEEGPSCVPQCAGKECGDDGCGGSCGECHDMALPICQAGSCVAECVPDCYGGKECGDNGCGGTCGECADGLSCDARQRCVHDDWTCDDSRYGDHVACDCGCGIRDPDCDLPLPLAGCRMGEVCGPSSTCISAATTGWTCESRFFNDGLFCDCGCGALDPDCAAGKPVQGCGAYDSCNAAGECAACVPQCDGKSCGSDGCGGTCGTCDDPSRPACVDGTCVNTCSPQPVRCLAHECGDDGCGGSCGTCGQGQQCSEGRCVEIAGDDTASCRLRCGSVAPSGCSCNALCVEQGTCCADFAAYCECEPQCDGKSCGPDGCGGSCGTCAQDAPYCTSEGACTASCTPQCDGRSCGDDGCGGSCGTCGSGSTCAFTGQCVPNRWTCDAFDYGEGRTCDCGCGVPDPDCERDELPTANCPRGVACRTDGYCDIDACDADDECGRLQCIGLYTTAPGDYGGTCGPVYPGAEPPGSSCEVHEDCANDVCLEGICRRNCREDADCSFGQHCLGHPVYGETHKLAGIAAVCDRPAGSLKACARQADCADHEICIPFIDPVTKGPRYLCGLPESNHALPGDSCETRTCAPGLFCEGQRGSRTCVTACPGGATECTAGWQCREIAFHNHGTLDPSDDPKVPVCAP